MITGGGHVPERTLDVLNSIGYPLCNGFGMTETGIIAVERSLDPKQRIKGSIGVPFTLTEWKLGEDGSDHGELFIRGNALYSASMIDGKIICRDKKAWFGTGDVVTKHPDGMYISGRVKDIIVGASGENIYPEELEDIFKNIDGVKNLCILGIKNGTYEDVAIVVEKGKDFEKEKVTEVIKKRNERLSAATKVVRLFASAKELPVSGNMKVKRQFLKNSIEEQTWDCEELPLYKAVKTINDNSNRSDLSKKENDPKFEKILEEIKMMTAESLGIDVDSIDVYSHFINELGGDSLTAFSVFAELEEKYDINFTEEEMMKLENCYDTARFIYCRKHIAGSPT